MPSLVKIDQPLLEQCVGPDARSDVFGRAYRLVCGGCGLLRSILNAERCRTKNEPSFHPDAAMPAAETDTTLVAYLWQTVFSCQDSDPPQPTSEPLYLPYIHRGNKQCGQWRHAEELPANHRL